MWITLTGFMGSGKSSVARVLGVELGLPVVDLDDRVEQAAGRSIAEIFAREGEAGFRRAELAALEALDPGRELVLDPGGGLIESEPACAMLAARGTVIWLDVRWDQVRDRLRGTEADRRPLVQQLGWDGLEQLYRRRQVLYARTADFRLSSHETSPEETARMVRLRLRSWRAAGRHRPGAEGARR